MATPTIPATLSTTPTTTPTTEITMEEFNAKRWLWTLASVTSIAISSLVVTGLIVHLLPHPSVSIFFVLWSLLLCGTLGLFIAHGIVEVPIDPPTKAMPIFRQKPVLRLLPPGWYFLPLKGDFFFNFILVNGEEIDLSWEVIIRAPDYCYINIPFFLYYFIDQENPLQYLIAGQRATIEKKLKQQIEEILREWITSPSKGPQNWMEARQAAEETVNAVLEILFDRDLARVNPISSEIPTEILFKCFDPQRKLSAAEKKAWKPKLDALTDTERRKLEGAVTRRHDIIKRARNGNLTEFRAVFAGMGVVISRIGLSNIEPIGKTADGVDEVVQAGFDKEKVEKDATAFREAVGKLKDVLGDAKEAREAESVRRGFTKEEIKENQFSLGPEMTQAAERVALAAIDALSKRGGGK